MPCVKILGFEVSGCKHEPCNKEMVKSRLRQATADVTYRVILNKVRSVTQNMTVTQLIADVEFIEPPPGYCLPGQKSTVVINQKIDGSMHVFLAVKDINARELTKSIMGSFTQDAIDSRAASSEAVSAATADFERKADVQFQYHDCGTNKKLHYTVRVNEKLESDLEATLRMTIAQMATQDSSTGQVIQRLRIYVPCERVVLNQEVLIRMVSDRPPAQVIFFN